MGEDVTEISMVETVARALFAKRMEAAARYPQLQQYNWEEENQPYREFCLSEARAAIEAMRSPTEAMKDAGIVGVGDFHYGDAGRVWEAMIDAALAAPTGERGRR
jgi:hypothetical protein